MLKFKFIIYKLKSLGEKKMEIVVKDNLLKKYINEKDWDNLLLRACEIGDNGAIDFAINNGANVNYANNFRQTPIMFLLKSADVATVKKLINLGADVSKIDSNGNSTYIYALGMDYKLAKDEYLEKDRTACVKCISDNHIADVNVQNSASISPLHLACRFGFNDAIETLLLEGANPNACDVKGDTPLVQCYLGKNDANDDILFDFGADVNVAKWQKHSVLYRVIASAMNDHKKREIINKLIDKGATIEAMQVEYEVDTAIADGVKQLAEIMMRKNLMNRIERRGDKTAKTFLGCEQYDALFEYLISKHCYDDAKVLVQMGYNLDGKNKQTGDTRLIKAVKDNNNNLAMFLVDNGAMINLRNKENKSATQVAIEENHKDIALYLLERGGHIYVNEETFANLNKKMGKNYSEILKRHSVILRRWNGRFKTDRNLSEECGRER